MKLIALPLKPRPVDPQVQAAWSHLCRRFNVELVYGVPRLPSSPVSASMWPGGGRIVVRPTLSPAEQYAAIAHSFRYFAGSSPEWGDLIADLEAARLSTVVDTPT